MISGIHAIIYSKQADRLRQFFRDVLELPSVDAGHGWLIFALPPAELAIHPEDDSDHELYLMCDDIQNTTDLLKAKKVELVTPIADRGWGLVTHLRLPSGDEIGLYQPKHPTAIALTKPQKPQRSVAPHPKTRSSSTAHRKRR